jgi:hypothetical protein
VAHLRFVGTLTGNRSIRLPVASTDADLAWTIENRTTGAFGLAVTGLLSAVPVPKGPGRAVTWDGSVLTLGAESFDTGNGDILGRMGAAAPTIVTLIGGQDDEAISVTNCTLSADTVNFVVGDRGHKLSFAGSANATAFLDPVGLTDPLVLTGVDCLGLSIYLEDATKIDQFGLHVFSDSGLATVTSYNTSTGLVTGWNRIRYRVTAQTLPANWFTCYRARVQVIANAATTATIGHAWAETRPLASILFVADHPAQALYLYGYEELKARRIPVTFGCDPALLGNGGAARRLSPISGDRMFEEDIGRLALENNNQVNFHSGNNATATSGMDAAAIRADCMQGLKWISQMASRYGFEPGFAWRSAWVNNDAPNHAASQPLLGAYATFGAGNSFVSCWPPIDPYNLPRVALHGVSNSGMDAFFLALKQTHGLLLCYTHGILDTGGIDMTNAEWDYFLTKLDDGIQGSWLEGVTMEILLARGGLRYRQGFGEARVDTTDAVGTLASRRLW